MAARVVRPFPEIGNRGLSKRMRRILPNTFYSRAISLAELANVPQGRTWENKHVPGTYLYARCIWLVVAELLPWVKLVPMALAFFPLPPSKRLADQRLHLRHERRRRPISRPA